MKGLETRTVQERRSNYAAGALDVLRPEDAQLVQRFLASLEARGRGSAVRYKRTWELRKISELLGKPLAEAGKDDIQELARRIRKATTKSGRPVSASYQFDLFTATKAFYKWLLGPKTDVLDDFEMHKPRPAELLVSKLITTEDVARMAAATTNLQEKALVTLLYATGARIGEVLNMKAGDVFTEGPELMARLDGKTGERVIPVGLPLAVGHLTEYLDAHHGPEGSALWVDAWDRALNYQDVRRRLDRISAVAGVSKKLNPHAFRHARASELAKHLNDQQLKYYFGWTRDSSMTARYIHRDKSIVLDKFAELYGKESGVKLDVDLAVLLQGFAAYFADEKKKLDLQDTLTKKGSWDSFQNALNDLRGAVRTESRSFLHKTEIPLGRFELPTP
ncbi:hypothetical protein AUJ14_04990 [Candidatus Micrarchaeota archaeon CG1_02_55_22]|nr:MAG: hypothetical protein AUJ14_04990 [Candidatus Micrarchaeota archaeon CG1_02_55_22]